MHVFIKKIGSLITKKTSKMNINWKNDKTIGNIKHYNRKIAVSFPTE